ncbi:hypothetical protein Cob_v000685 [Colletotrichum orbiculare MAFF 240422]|uniref:Uncharacterized protein n=1 Tax=Colletotrichum orbiculare (strain 104-T / ATCC 96160 / CBS 514.97 / LARS 414 / MAFF 240422) TaxID=1213857 RepID=A0A484GAZ4_COLOR|nr:hypothetical protein Cob_v000685 [Colletotrichum orbiculare MAFF 240422]
MDTKRHVVFGPMFTTITVYTFTRRKHAALRTHLFLIKALDGQTTSDLWPTTATPRNARKTLQEKEANLSHISLYCPANLYGQVPHKMHPLYNTRALLLHQGRAPSSSAIAVRENA